MAILIRTDIFCQYNVPHRIQAEKYKIVVSVKKYDRIFFNFIFRAIQWTKAFPKETQEAKLCI